MKRRHALIASLLMLAGCTRLAATRYHALADGSPRPKPAAAAPEYRIAIGPVTVPDALDRSQIVLRVAPNRYAISDTERWSSPLKREIPRVLAEGVAQRLPAARVTAHEQHGGQDADYRVTIDVARFESVPGESIALEAAWAVRSRAGERLREAHSVVIERVNVPGIEPLVAAHREALGVLAREIAEAVSAHAQAKR